MAETSTGKGVQPGARWIEGQLYAQIGKAPAGLINLNVRGRQPTSPVQGFGRMWLRTYCIPLPGINQAPEKVVAEWKANFSHFWSPGNTFHTFGDGIKPGVTGLINITLPGGLKLATGAVVMYADERSFSLMTVQGHMFCGWITFSAYKEDDVVYAQVQALVRPNDIIFELSFRIGFGIKAEDTFWHQTLINLAQHFGIDSSVQQTNQLIDDQVQWRYFHNIWYNAGIRSGIYQVTTPFRWLVNQIYK